MMIMGGIQYVGEIPLRLTIMVSQNYATKEYGTNLVKSICLASPVKMVFEA
jgi:hypothetical protein